MKSVSRLAAVAALLLVSLSVLAAGQRFPPIPISGMARAEAVATIRPYVLYYEGPIEGSTDEIAKSIEGLLGDIDRSKVTNERAKKNITGTNIYWLEMSVEPIAAQAAGYLQSYISAHKEFEVGNLKLTLRPANQVIEVSSITGFGPDETGKEVSWGGFTRLGSFSNLGAYDTHCLINVGPTLAGGHEDEILKLLPAIMSPADAYLFSSMVSGTSPFQHKMSRFNWNSHSYFVMEDGTYINRALYFNVDRKMTSQNVESRVTRRLEPGYEPAGEGE